MFHRIPFQKWWYKSWHEAVLCFWVQNWTAHEMLLLLHSELKKAVRTLYYTSWWSKGVPEWHLSTQESTRVPCWTTLASLPPCLSTAIYWRTSNILCSYLRSAIYCCFLQTAKVKIKYFSSRMQFEQTVFSSVRSRWYENHLLHISLPSKHCKLLVCCLAVGQQQNCCEWKWWPCGQCTWTGC